MIILSKEQILMLHSQLIEATGGSDGIRDEGMLESAISNPFQTFGGKELYPSIQAKAAQTILSVAAGKLDATDILKWIIAHQKQKSLFDGVPAPSKEIINQPELQVYVKDFGENKGDLCLVAEVNNEIVGAVWVRIMNDYGHVDNETPSFAISLLKEYRNYGIGTELMKTMLAELKASGYKQASLAVQKQNYAVQMYQKLGFQIVDENEEEYIMVCQLLR